jgi:hypothetical protein
MYGRFLAVPGDFDAHWSATRGAVCAHVNTAPVFRCRRSGDDDA